MKLPKELIHKIRAGIQTTVRESIQPQKGKLVLLLKRLKGTKKEKELGLEIIYLVITNLHF